MKPGMLASIRQELSRHINSSSEIMGGPWEIRESNNMIGFVYVVNVGTDHYEHYYLCTDNNHVPLPGVGGGTSVEYSFVQTDSMINNWSSKEDMEVGVSKDYPSTNFTKIKCEEQYLSGW